MAHVEFNDNLISEGVEGVLGVTRQKKNRFLIEK